MAFATNYFCFVKTFCCCCGTCGGTDPTMRRQLSVVAVVVVVVDGVDGGGGVGGESPKLLQRGRKSPSKADQKTYHRNKNKAI